MLVTNIDLCGGPVQSAIDAMVDGLIDGPIPRDRADELSVACRTNPTACSSIAKAGSTDAPRPVRLRPHADPFDSGSALARSMPDRGVLPESFKADYLDCCTAMRRARSTGSRCTASRSARWLRTRRSGCSHGSPNCARKASRQ